MAQPKSGKVVLLTVLSGVELLGLLYVLFIRLSEIRHAVEKVQNSITHIMWGVRAIETQTAPLAEQGQVLQRTLTDLADGVETVVTHFGSAEQHLSQIGGQ